MITTELDRYEYIGSADPVVFRSGGTDIPIRNTAHVKVYVTTTGDFTVDITDNHLDDAGHGHLTGQQITLSSATSLPTGLLANTVYYVVNPTLNTNNSFQVALTEGGTPVTFTTTGSGTLTWTKTLLKTISTDYNVSLVGTTATIDWVTGKVPGSSDKVLFLRDVTFEQTTDLQNNSQFEAESVEGQLDLMVNMSQQLKNTSGRQFKFSSSLVASDATETSATLTATSAGRADKGLRFDSLGNLGVSAIDIDLAQDYILGAKSWAIEDGLVQTYSRTVASNDSSSEYSSKDYAVGDPPDGSSKEWATDTDAVTGSLYSSKEYAQGSTAATGGSSKNWASQTGVSNVTGGSSGDFSAKSWALEEGANAPTDGSAKQWATLATTPSGTAEDASAKEWAIGTSTHKPDGSAKTWASETGAGESGHITGGASGDKSAKSWASETGGNAPADGSAKEWATTDTSAVASSLFSAKEYASGSSATGGTSKQWSLGGGSHAIGTAVAGTDYASKAYAQSATAGTDTYGGSSKGWASTAYDTQVPGASSANRSALHYSTDASNSALAAKASAAAVASTFDSFDDTYLGTMGTGSTQGTNPATNGTWAKNSSSITVASGANIKIGQLVTNTSGGSAIPTGANVLSISGSGSDETVVISENMVAAGTTVNLTFTGYGVYGTYNGGKVGPTTDNDNVALADGMLYFNTSTNNMMVYKETGASWILATSAGEVSMIVHKYTVASGTPTSVAAALFSPTLTYVASNIIVFLNGVRLEGGGVDYTASNGADIISLAALAVGDELVVLAFKQFTVADAVSAASGGTFSGAVTFGAGLVANTVDINGGTIDGATITGNIVGNASGTAATVTGGTQSAITTATNLTSVGTLTAVTVTGAITANGGLETDTNSKVKQKGAFMQSSTHQALTLGG